MAQTDESSLSSREAVITQLCSAQKLERDKGITSLQHFISTGNEKEIWALYNSCLNLARSPDTPWESKLGALMGIRAIISNYKGTLMVCDFQSLTQEVREVALDLLVHPEVRVRIAAGEKVFIGCLIM